MWAGFEPCLWNLTAVCLWAGHIHAEPKLPLPHNRNRRLLSAQLGGWILTHAWQLATGLAQSRAAVTAYPLQTGVKSPVEREAEVGIGSWEGIGLEDRLMGTPPKGISPGTAPPLRARLSPRQCHQC